MKTCMSRSHPSRVTPRGALTAGGRWTALSFSVLMLAAAGQAGAADWDAGPRPSRSEVPAPKILNFEKASTADPESDTFGSGATQIDINGFSADFDDTELMIALTFAGAISAPDSGQANAVVGYVDIDADQNGLTGNGPWTDFLTGSNATGLGNEYYVDLFSYAAADGAVDVYDDNTGVMTGRAPVSFTSNSLSVQIPLSLLGGDDGAVNTAAVVGTVTEVTDKVPNAGYLASGQSNPPGETIYLLSDRFELTVDTKDPLGVERPGRLITQSADSAVLYFFNQDNWEMLIKVLDGCDYNDRYWVFFAATTDVEFTLTVTDTDTGQYKEYTNDLGHSADAVTDTDAFATCP